MVRLGGRTYTIDPERPSGRRISEIRVGGRALNAARRDRSTGGASLGAAHGPPAWDVAAAHLRDLPRVKVDPRPRVKVLSRAV